LQTVYEYILAGLIILLVLMTTEMTMLSLMSQRLTALEQESSYTTADKILDILLLSPGNPTNWGNNFSREPDLLGLADENSVKAYVLDPYKVARFQENSTGYISPSKTRTLLGLRGTYQFSLRLTPILNITVEGNGCFTVTVRNVKGFLASNINITAYYVSRSLKQGVDYPVKSNVTMIDGTCTLEFQPEPDHVLVIQAAQLGVKVLVTYPAGLNFRIEGGRVFESDTPLTGELNYSTGSGSGLSKESASRYVEIGGSTYLAELDLWG